MLVLVVQTGKYKGKRLKIGDSELIIGRDEDAAVRIGSSEVSRQHCLLTPTDEGLSVRDLGSRNGTFVDGAPIGPSEEVLLKPGVSLTVGPMTFQLIDTTVEVKGPTESAAISGKDPSLSDDDIATWLTETDTSDELSTSDTTIITGRDALAAGNEPILDGGGRGKSSARLRLWQSTRSIAQRAIPRHPAAPPDRGGATGKRCAEGRTGVHTG